MGKICEPAITNNPGNRGSIMKPKISIITVCYNSENTILKAMESVRLQNYANIEYIIIDGNSTDRTRLLIANYKNKFGMPNKYISETDSGIYNAMNKGISQATGDHICMLNSDDWLEDGALDIIAETYRPEEKYCVYYGLERRIKDGKEESVGFHGHEFLQEASLPHQTCYITRSCYQDLALYNENYVAAADYDLLIRLYLSKRVLFIPIYSILANFSVGGMSSKAIGFKEEAKIRYGYGLITRKKYIYLRFRVWFLKMIGALR